MTLLSFEWASKVDFADQIWRFKEDKINTSSHFIQDITISLKLGIGCSTEMNIFRCHFTRYMQIKVVTPFIWVDRISKLSLFTQYEIAEVCWSTTCVQIDASSPYKHVTDWRSRHKYATVRDIRSNKYDDNVNTSIQGLRISAFMNINRAFHIFQNSCIYITLSSNSEMRTKCTCISSSCAFPREIKYLRCIQAFCESTAIFQIKDVYCEVS